MQKCLLLAALSVGLLVVNSSFAATLTAVPMQGGMVMPMVSSTLGLAVFR